MPDKFMRSKEPGSMKGVKQPNELSTIQGPMYDEPKEKSSNLWNMNALKKKSSGHVRG